MKITVMQRTIEQTLCSVFQRQNIFLSLLSQYRELQRDPLELNTIVLSIGIYFI